MSDLTKRQLQTIRRVQDLAVNNLQQLDRSSFRIDKETAADDEGGLLVLSRRLTMTRVWLSTTLPFFIQNRRRKQLQTMKGFDCAAEKEESRLVRCVVLEGFLFPCDAG